MTTLLWEECWEKRTPRSRSRALLRLNLYVGALTYPIATLYLAEQWYALETDIEIKMSRTYLPLEQARVEVEQLLRAYLDKLRSDELHELCDGAGI